jgi:hypothetical protein
MYVGMQEPDMQRPIVRRKLYHVEDRIAPLASYVR